MNLPALRRTGALLVAGMMIIILAACNSGAADRSSSGADSGNPSAGSGAYPLTMETIHGTVTIPAKPQRIVVLGGSSAGDLLALGVTPYKVAQDPATVKESLPWLADRIADLCAADLMSGSDVNVEAIAALKPDLIIGNTFVLAEAEVYSRLNRVAPTIMPGEKQVNVDWDERLRYEAKAVDAGDKAEELITSTRDKYAAVAKTVPGISGKTYNWAAYGKGGYGMGNGSMLELFGLKPAKSQDNSNTKSLSAENAEQLDADLLAIWPQTEQNQAHLEKDPIFQSLPAAKNDTVYFASLADADALNSPDPLGLDWFLKRITPTVKKLG